MADPVPVGFAGVPTGTTSLAAFIDALPKVELHVHLVGSAGARGTIDGAPWPGRGCRRGVVSYGADEPTRGGIRE